MISFIDEQGKNKDEVIGNTQIIGRQRVDSMVGNTNTIRDFDASNLIIPVNNKSDMLDASSKNKETVISPVANIIENKKHFELDSSVIISPKASVDFKKDIENVMDE